MSHLPRDWIDDEPEDDEPDFSGLCSDPASIIADHVLLQLDALNAEGYTRVEIVAGLSLALADFTQDTLA